ncbi:murein biosynthesis integral membrane protein MurJ [Streptomyces sp. NPDC005438]|uniref:murein biosynthesis integral membrane protein MurJ n=1 Tax=Streptomyces sp. NPDC005438 TaxID=3156880 RepID=UPI0033B0E6D2
MNAPYEGEHGPRPEGAGPPQPDPYVRDAYTHDPYAHRDPQAQDPVGEALYDHAAHPPPPPPPEPEPGPYQPPVDSSTVRFTGVDELISSRPAEAHPGADAFAHLYRDQGHHPEQGSTPQQPHQPPPPPPPVPSSAPPGYRQASEPTPEPASVEPPSPPDDTTGTQPAATGGGGGGGILKSSAIMAAGTLVSRITGFFRTLVITAALGAAVLGDTYTIAYTLPTMIYVLTIGGGLNSVFVPQLVRAMKTDEDGGAAYANRLLTLVMVILGGMIAVAVLAAPLLVRMMSPAIAGDEAANAVTVTFARYCLPTIFFMGVHVVMGQILNARGHFGAMMWTPVLNNVVVIFSFGAFLWVYGLHRSSQLGVETITPEGVRLLGVGTLLGLVVQALAMIPYLRKAGFHFRPRFDWRGHGMGKAARLAKWTVLFVLANQAGVVVVTQLATWAGKTASEQGHPGTGILGYSNAQLIWQMPQAIITVSVMAALLPRISRSAADGDPGAVRDDISQGLRNSAVAIVPIACGFLSLGVPMCLLMYFSSGESAASSMGYILMAFGLGLIPYSVQYVVLRGFYAFEDTRTPFYNTVVVALCNAAGSLLCFAVLPARWAVVGMAASYGLAYAVGVGIAWRRLRLRLGGDLDGARVMRTYARLGGAALPATVLSAGVAFGLLHLLGRGAFGGLVSLVAGGICLGLVFVLAAKRMRIQELTAMLGMVRTRLGR